MSQDILVALDPFANDQVSLKKAMNTTKNLANALDTVIDPVSVVSPDQLQWPSRFDGTWAKQFEKAARASLKKVATSTGIKVENIEILSQPVHSLKASVTALIDEADKRKPLAIAVFTHHRKSPAFRFFGTFATALLAKGSCPLVFVNAKGKDVRAFKRVLFATDFSPESERAFASVVKMALTMRAEIILFHALVPINVEVYASAGLMGGIANYDAFVKDEEEQSTSDAKRWIETARAAGVEARFSLQHASFRASVAIVEAAHSLKADMIAVCSKTTGASVVFLGSVTRDLIETSKLPLLVIPASAVSVETTTARATRDRKATRNLATPSSTR